MSDVVDLREEIHNSLKKGVLNDKCFMPAKASELTTEGIERILRENVKSGRILSSIQPLPPQASKVVVTLLYMKEWWPKDLICIITLIRKHNITDANLPIREHEITHADLPSGGGSPSLLVEALRNKLKHMDLFDFFKNQWMFLAPVFDPPNKRHVLEGEIPLPFIDQGQSTIQGGFSEVMKVKVHGDHLPRQQRKDQTRLWFALKRLKRPYGLPEDEPYDIEKEWKRETMGLDHAHNTKNQHLLRPNAIFTWGKEYYFLTEWAHMGSLNNYWQKDPEPYLNGNLVLEVLEQMHGVAKALCAIHESSSEAGNRRHGDLKPDNILRFSKSGRDETKLGILRISDFGTVKLNAQVTTLRAGIKTTGDPTTRVYQAPEVLTSDGKDAPRSRRFDTWAMGCVMLEFLIWLLYGQQGLNNFNNTSYLDDPTSARESFFYKIDTEEVGHVHKIATKWMEEIGQDERCIDGTALHDLLLLIQNKLLRIESRDPQSPRPKLKKSRYNSRELSDELGRILDKARNQPCYRFRCVIREKNLPPDPMKFARHERSIELHAARTLHPLEEYLNDDWEYLIDNQFANDVLKQPEVQSAASLPKTDILCGYCRSLDVTSSSFEVTDTLSALRERSPRCAFCKLLFQTCEPLSKREDIYIYRNVSTLRMTGVRSPILSIYGSQGVKPDASIQAGLPQLPEVGSQAHIAIIRQWLSECDKTHACCPAQADPMPKRVIDVGGEQSQSVSLYETAGERDAYIALSHRWGNMDAHPLFCTYPHNIDQFKMVIRDQNLPQTFKDAVKVTRQLGIRYLWIDSLCIVQGPDGDWAEQAECMEDIFHSAYFVVAASCATGMMDGFLKARSPRDCVTFSDGSGSGSVIYVCEAIDNFDADVIKGGLNERGWVLQERALARRTIHFTAKQTYWECGDGIRCETLTKMRNTKASFLGDPYFPTLAMSMSKGGKIRLYETLYRQYSRLVLSFATDRPLAIDGIEKRMIKALGVRGGYGIFDGKGAGFESYLGRSLLWKRGSDDMPMRRIGFGTRRIFPVPSWSWMAYDGPIDYMDLPFDEVDWEKEGIQSPWSHIPLQTTWHTTNRIGHAELKGVARDFTHQVQDGVILDESDGAKDRELKCVVIGRLKSGISVAQKTHYILVVCRKDREIWERAGVGAVSGSSIVLNGPGVKVLIS